MHFRIDSKCTSCLVGLGTISLLFIKMISACILSDYREDHLNHLKSVFDILGAADLQISLLKCEFMKSSVRYLGHEVDDYSEPHY